jgi:hypothetical protein
VSDLSDITINGERQTWQQLYEREKAQTYRLQACARLLADLDRNENGRHQGDMDSFTPSGTSQGNPHLQTGDVIGYALGGRQYVVPEPELRSDPAAWLRESTDSES